MKTKVNISLFNCCYLYKYTLEKKPKGQSRMNNPEKLATKGTQDTARRQTKQNSTT
jgi:hypothetical protein